MDSLDSLVVTLAGLIAIYLILSGMDDLFVEAAWLWSTVRGWWRPAVPRPDAELLARLPEKRFAIFVPAWHEAPVIARMLEHNLATLRYQHYDFFVGAYPNDPDTIRAVEEVARKHRQVHLCLTPHPGPTSKADCLNWVYQGLMMEEERAGVTYDFMVTHDAEDLIHPESLRWLNYYGTHYDYLQMPVLALPTPITQWTHGVYADEFAEVQTRDQPARLALGSFLPSAGVGTAYSRRALEALAQAGQNCIFQPGCLTEDYENGIRIHHLGLASCFVPLSLDGADFVATREFFPQTWRTAIRQRSRWITGIALQTWERHGWRGSWADKYWLWRDRKGLWNNPISILANVLFVYGLATGLYLRLSQSPWVAHALILTTALIGWRMAFRVACTARLYGAWFAMWAPVRMLWSNAINCAATYLAVTRYVRARLRGQPLVWVKTAHQYPGRAALVTQRRRLGEILVASGVMGAHTLELALQSVPPGMRLGEYLLRLGVIREEDLYQALSLQQQLPWRRLEPAEVAPRVARSLPRHVVRDWHVLPFRVDAGGLLLCSPEAPTEQMTTALRQYTRLEIRFHLVTPSNFRELEQSVLPAEMISAGPPPRIPE